MSELHIRQIRASLEKNFADLIDVTDLQKLPVAEREAAFLSRAQAALALTHIGAISTEDAAASVTDGFKDNGIDAAYYHLAERTLYLVQSKWRADGSGSVSRGEIQKFIKGFKDLINARWDRFPGRISKRKGVIEGALNDASTKIVLMVACTGESALSDDVRSDLKDVVDETNTPTEIVSTHTLRQGDIYAIVQQGVGGAAIDVELALYDWGQVREPYQGFYGQVAASDVAKWLTTYQSRLFAPNLRVFLGSTDVNSGMVETLTKAPENFWYFNNGITALTRKIAKKPIGGNTRETGFFECSDLRVVNGAQTVGAIADAASKDPASVGRARVTIRLISLENCPPGFDKEITRYNNSQNRIERRDFVALDSQQERIASELALEGITYLYKSGETLLGQDNGFDIVEATVARACAQPDVAYAVHAKAEIGRLWDDIEKPPYRVLFNGSVTGPSIWRLVQIARIVERKLSSIRTETDGRARLLAIHGNRFLVHLVMRSLPDRRAGAMAALTPRESNMIEKTAASVFEAVLEIVNDAYPDAYLANLFKNIEKCKAVAEAFRARQSAG